MFTANEYVRWKEQSHTVYESAEVQTSSTSLRRRSAVLDDDINMPDGVSLSSDRAFEEILPIMGSNIEYFAALLRKLLHAQFDGLQNIAFTTDSNEDWKKK